MRGSIKEKLSKIKIKSKHGLKDLVIQTEEEIKGSFSENYIYRKKYKIKRSHKYE